MLEATHLRDYKQRVPRFGDLFGVKSEPEFRDKRMGRLGEIRDLELEEDGLSTVVWSSFSVEPRRLDLS